MSPCRVYGKVARGLVPIYQGRLRQLFIISRDLNVMERILRDASRVRMARNARDDRFNGHNLCVAFRMAKICYDCLQDLFGRRIAAISCVMRAKPVNVSINYRRVIRRRATLVQVHVMSISRSTSRVIKARFAPCRRATRRVFALRANMASYRRLISINFLNPRIVLVGRNRKVGLRGIATENHKRSHRDRCC